MTIVTPSRKKFQTQSHSHNPEKMLIGRLEGKLETVKNMVGSGVDIALIAKFTDLTCNQIEGIKNHCSNFS